LQTLYIIKEYPLKLYIRHGIGRTIRIVKRVTAQVVARLLFVYKAEFPDPDECIRQVQAAVEQEFDKLKAVLHAYQALFETVCEVQKEDDSETPDRDTYAA
jgi:hypothetical protein